MADRNQSIIHEIIAAIGGSREQEQRLRHHFKDKLILDAGNTQQISNYAKKLRLEANEQECSQVLDAIAERQMVGIDIEHVDEVVNDLFPNRFIEP